MNQKSIQEIQIELEKDEDEAIQFVEWVQERCNELGVSESYFFMEFI